MGANSNNRKAWSSFFFRYKTLTRKDRNLKTWTIEVFLYLCTVGYVEVVGAGPLVPVVRILSSSLPVYRRVRGTVEVVGAGPLVPVVRILSSSLPVYRRGRGSGGCWSTGSCRTDPVVFPSGRRRTRQGCPCTCLHPRS